MLLDSEQEETLPLWIYADNADELSYSHPHITMTNSSDHFYLGDQFHKLLSS